MNSPVKTIVVIGQGFAGQLTALALAERLPTDINIVLVQDKTDNASDMFFGNVTSPSTYNFLLSLNISEPELLLSTDTSFSLGTQFKNWGALKRSWIQTFYRPLPIHHGVKFQHYVNRSTQGKSDWSLEPYIMSVQAAKKGVFAHPPEGKNIPLATVEYGYHYDPRKWTGLLTAKVQSNRVKLVSDTVSGDLFIDCRPQSDDTHFENGQQLMGATFDTPSSQLTAVVRTLSETEFGWRATTPLRGRTNTFCIYGADDQKVFERSHPEAAQNASISTGRLDAPWQDNVLKLGHSAGALEPLTPAPIMALQSDIDRLIELIPTRTNMSVEAREYNRRFVQDFDNAAMFQRALLGEEDKSISAYARNARQTPMTPALRPKITQFENRGVYVGYDNELFCEEDWVQMHLGMRRTPKRYDPLTDRASEAQIAQMLDNMKRANTHMAKKMPPHELYMTNLLKFLKDKHG